MKKLPFVATAVLLSTALLAVTVVYGQTADTSLKKLKLPSGMEPPKMPDEKMRKKDSIETKKQLDEVNRRVAKFKSTQQQLDGCWKTKYYQFRYSAGDNSGIEYKSQVHSSAPIFSLILKDTDVYLKWVELTGGGTLQKVIDISKNKFTVVNEDGKKIIYKRNTGCK